MPKIGEVLIKFDVVVNSKDSKDEEYLRTILYKFFEHSAETVIKYGNTRESLMNGSYKMILG